MSDDARTVRIPRHTAINDFKIGKIAKDAGYTPEQFWALL